MEAAMAPPTNGEAGGGLTTTFSRGQPGDADTRGATLVAKHQELQAQRREAAALERLAAAMPRIGAPARALALAEADWDADAAVGLLRQFQVANLDRLDVLQQRRKKLREGIEKAAADGGGARGGGGGSGGGDGDGGGSDGEGGGGDKRAKRKSSSSRRRTRSRSRSRSRERERSKRSSSSRHHRSSSGRRHRRTRSRSRSRSASPAAARRSKDSSAARPPSSAKKAEDTYGKHGVIRPSDALHEEGKKRSEFMAWLVDAERLDPDALSKSAEEAAAAKFAEAFNTCTLGEARFYDLQAAEREAREGRERARAVALAGGAGAGAGGGGEGGGGQAGGARADAQRFAAERAEQERREQQERLAAAMAAMRHGGLAQDMREQAMLRAEIDLAYKTGDTARARKLAARLLPEKK